MSEEKPKKKRGRPKGSKNKPTKPKAEVKVEEPQFETKLSEAKVEEPQFETKLSEAKPEKQTEKESKNSDEMIAWCGACRFEIIGNSNWIRHIESKEHLSNVEKFSKPILKDTNQIKQSIQKKSPNNGLIAGLIVAVGVAMFLVGVMMPDSQNLEDYVTKSDLEDSISRLEEKLDNIQQSTPVRQPTQPSTSPIIQVSVDDDPIKGNPDAPVTVIEFSDFQCPFCLRFYDQTFPLIEKNYIDTGKVKYVYRDFPIDSLHPNARPSHIAAECADEQGKFWEYHDMLFDKQADWKNLTPENLKSELKMYATSLGLSGGIFESCLSSEEIAAEVDADLLHAGIAGATGTPTFFIGNEKDGFVKLVGAKPYSSFQDAIDSQLVVAKETLSEHIPWSENRSIQWSEFRAITSLDNRPGIDYNPKATTMTGVTAFFDFTKSDSLFCEYEIIKMNATAYFFPYKSWKTNKIQLNDYLLKHEQGHFDIAEFHARKLNILENQTFPCPDGKYDETKINEEILEKIRRNGEEYGEMGILYDTETSGSKIKSKQTEWNNKIKFLIDYYYPPTMAELEIPLEVKNIFFRYSEDKIPEEEMIASLEFMIEKGIIQTNH